MFAMEDALLFVGAMLLHACPVVNYRSMICAQCLKRKWYCNLIRAAASGLVCGILAWLKIEIYIEQRALVVLINEGYSGPAIARKIEISACGVQAGRL